ncbi:MAG: phosphate acyltransferase PlsX [Clostridiales bacterium]|nr:phosphate acyltransferase PlsX [Clostridiales bacterium]
MRVLVDAFGGDFAPAEIVAGAVEALKADKNLSVTLYGEDETIESLLSKHSYDKSRLSVVHAPEVITNEESPTMAVKIKKNSSLVKALEDLSSDPTADAFVSAGSTGAVLTGAFMRVGRISGVSRPALAPLLPTVKGGQVVLCDCGANVDCKPINLLHFGYMGAAFAKAMAISDNPRVGLLSNGAEETKGNQLNKEAIEYLKNSGLNFVGNCEARDLLSGDFDVVVCDGFNGNIALKSAEGTANAIFTLLKEEINNGGARAKLGALMLYPALKKLKKRMDYNENGGACFLGVNKVVVKAHGASKAKSISAAIMQAKTLAEREVIKNIAEYMEQAKDII